MYNPSKRNRNIGTSKQGHGQNNKMSIPYSFEVGKEFYERLGNYSKKVEIINGHEFYFIIEETRKTSMHACSVEEVVTILKELPVEDFGELKLIIFRQPKRKEEILSSVWGRLIYSFNFEGNYYPAIILDAINYETRFKWKKNLSIESQKELSRLRLDGHNIIDTGRFYEADYELDFVRNTQLYRTLLHELGHYVQYLNVVGRPADKEEDEDYEEKDIALENYFRIPSIEKERFAHNYADQMKIKLESRKVIPFDRKEKY